MKVIRNANDNTFCGPAALSLITGKPVSECTAALRAATGRRAIFGVAYREMMAVLPMLGYIAAPIPIGDKPPTLAALLRKLKDRRPEDVYLLSVTDHYLVLRGRKIYDNRNPEGVFVRQYPHRRVRVKGIFGTMQVPHA